MDQFRYIKIQPNRPQNEALGNKPHKLCTYSPEPRTEVYCLRMNFNISKLVYSPRFLWRVEDRMTGFHCTQFTIYRNNHRQKQTRQLRTPLEPFLIYGKAITQSSKGIKNASPYLPPQRIVLGIRLTSLRFRKL